MDWKDKLIQIEFKERDGKDNLVYVDCYFIEETNEYLIVKENNRVRNYFKSNILSWGESDTKIFNEALELQEDKVNEIENVTAPIEDNSLEYKEESTPDNDLSLFVKKHWKIITMILVCLFVLFLFR